MNPDYFYTHCGNLYRKSDFISVQSLVREEYEFGALYLFRKREFKKVFYVELKTKHSTISWDCNSSEEADAIRDEIIANLTK